MVSVRNMTFTFALALVASSAFAQSQALTTGPATAAEPLTAAQVSVACAPLPILGVVPNDAPRIKGNQDTVTRSLFGDPGHMVVNAGTDRGVQLNQRYFVRRIFRGAETHSDKLAHMVLTAGWVRISATNKLMALATAEHSCGDILEGDYLEPFYAPAVPADLMVANTTGELDFKAYGHVLYGHSERQSGATGEFMLVDRGIDKNVAVGSAFAIYRDREVTGLPLTPIGEATVVSVGPTLSVVRITAARDAIFARDVAVPRGPAATPKADVEALVPLTAVVSPAIEEPSQMLSGISAAIQELAQYRQLMADDKAEEATPHLKSASNLIRGLPRPRLEIKQGAPSEVSLRSANEPPMPAAPGDVYLLVQNAIRALTEYGSLMTDDAPRGADERLRAARQTVEQLQKRPR